MIDIVFLKIWYDESCITMKEVVLEDTEWQMNEWWEDGYKSVDNSGASLSLVVISGTTDLASSLGTNGHVKQ